ncbi:hypothetical protein EG831_10710 [bacterium]|nr:hypothetical protein [bacterium]
MTWSVFFLVPTGRGLPEDEISPDDYEAVLNFLYDASKYVSLKTTEGHHYKRVVLQRAFLEAHGLPAEEYMHLNGTYHRLMAKLRQHTGDLPLRAEEPERMRRTPLHVNAGDGFVLVSLLGEVFPSGYLPLSAGNVRRTPLHVNAGDGFVFVSLLGEVFPSGYLPLSAGNVRQTPLKDIYQGSELFRALRDKDALQGRCGQCEYRYMCGGSRSRAYAVSENYLAEEPFCSYQPGSFPFPEAIPAPKF